jgi:tetratricopeptide (TPR) repeat protein
MSGWSRPIWMVPRRQDPQFVGRKDELRAIKQNLAGAGSSTLTQPVAIHGLGGVGKTSLAVEFAYWRADDYNAVLWLSAEDPTTLASAYADLAGELLLPEASALDPSSRIAAVRLWLRDHGSWLLVFDNAERREDVEPYVPSRIIGHVLITSRHPDWGNLARSIKVPPLPPSDSVKLLLQGLEGGNTTEPCGLADDLGGLPLALAQANAYIRRTACSFRDYRERFRVQGTEFDHRQMAEPGYGRTVAATLALALDRLRTEPELNSPAERLLARCAFYAPEGIPRDLFTDLFRNEPLLEEAIETSRAYSLIETKNGAISVHRLVQWAVRTRIGSAAWCEVAGHAVRRAFELFPSDADDAGAWPVCRPILEHALCAAEHALGRNVDVAIAAGLLERIGVHLRGVLDQSRARELLLRALKTKESIYGLSHPEVAQTLGHLGRLDRIEGALPEAQRHLERALTILESANGREQVEVARVFNSLGIVARDQGDLNKARELFHRARLIYEVDHTVEPKRLVFALNNLANVARKQGNLAESRQLLDRSLSLNELAYGADHPSVARTLTHLGRTIHQEGHLFAARQYLERALRIKEATFGDRHPEVAITIRSLGDVARDRRDWAEAERCYRRALSINESAYGRDHPQVARSLAALGSLLAQTGHLIQALPLVKQAVEILHGTLGDQHPDSIPIHQRLHDIENQIRKSKPMLETTIPKIKILFLAANPAGTKPLMLDEEIRQITAKIRASEYRDSLEPISRWAVRPDDLLQTLLEHKPHIVHFSGHGSPTAEIILQDQNGRPQPVSKEALVHLFRTLKDNVRLVLFNACSTRSQAKAIAQIIDCAVGMNQPIGDDAAIVFAASFYRAIGFGRTVQEAFDLAKVALLLEGIPEDKTPEMYVRRGVDASKIILVTPPGRPDEDVQSPQKAGGDPAESFQSMDRTTFVKTLRALSPSDFDSFVASLENAATHISRHGTVPEKTAELIRWAESSTGPGLAAIQDAWANFG